MTDSPVVGSEATTAGPRLLGSVPALDGLRGVAVLMVIWFHTTILVPAWHHRFIIDGGLGVDAFFVLSGFLITALLLREQALEGRVRIGRFYLRRALRLLPALVVLLGAHAVYASFAHLPAAPERSSLTSVLFYYLNTGLRRLPLTQGVGHLWSLSVEEQFYILWPLCIVLLVGLRRHMSTVVIVMVGAIVAIDVHRALLYQHHSPILTLYTETITRADSLLVGALLAQLWVRRKVPTRGLALVAWPALALYLFLATNGASKRFLYNGGFTVVALAVAVMILALLESNWSFARVLCIPPLRTVGRVSYGLYIWHLAVFQAVVHYGTNWSSTTRLATGLGVTAAACWLSWTFVEQPFLRWKARLEPGRRRARPETRDADPPHLVGAPVPPLLDPSTR